MGNNREGHCPHAALVGSLEDWLLRETESLANRGAFSLIQQVSPYNFTLCTTIYDSVISLENNVSDSPVQRSLEGLCEMGGMVVALQISQQIPVFSITLGEGGEGER